MYSVFVYKIAIIQYNINITAQVYISFSSVPLCKCSPMGLKYDVRFLSDHMK